MLIDVELDLVAHELAELRRRDGVELNALAIEVLGAGVGLLGRPGREIPLLDLRRRDRDPLELDQPIRELVQVLLEWSVPDDAELELEHVLAANPASWIDADGLAEQREAVPEIAFRRFHCNQWVARIGSWLPAGAWQQCAGTPELEDGERIWIGVDVGGSRADSAVVWVNERLHVGVRIFSGEDAVLDVAAFVPALAERYAIQAAVFDPWRAGQMAREWAQRGIQPVDFPQHDSNMIPASQALYDAIVEQRLVHPDDPDLNRHVAAAVARHGRRGWRIDKAERGENIDGVVALCMAVQVAQARPEPVKLLGWI